MNPVGRNLTDAVGGVLNGKRYLIHDRDPLFTAEFLESAGRSGCCLGEPSMAQSQSGVTAAARVLMLMAQHGLAQR